MDAGSVVLSSSMARTCAVPVQLQVSLMRWGTMNHENMTAVLGNTVQLELVNADKIWIMICRVLNMIDSRLVDHGVKVALVLMDMLNVEGKRNEAERNTLGIMALFHDIGAYRSSEIQKLLQFETRNVWQHAIYSYLFLKPFFSDSVFTRAVLYHHAQYDGGWEDDPVALHYGQLLHIADRVCIWHGEIQGSYEALEAHLLDKSGSLFSPEGVSLFQKANRKFGTWERLGAKIPVEQLTSTRPMSVEEVNRYFYILVESIDFRSRTTVLHTRGVMEIAFELARRLALPEVLQQKIYCGALIHDLGKIGTPLSILEKPGRLTPEEMEIMRQHILCGEQIIQGCVEEETAQIGMRHHEKLNGRGYPHGLCSRQLTLPQRLMAVADVLSALCMNRSYKKAFSKEKTLSILREMADKDELDRDLVEFAAQNFDPVIAAATERCDVIERMYLDMQEQFQILSRRFMAESQSNSSTHAERNPIP